MITLQKGFPHNEDYVDFINYAFGMNGADSSFPSLLPKLYGEGKESGPVTYFALGNGRILGTVGAFPLTFSVDGETLSLRGVGSVATHPRRRGEGFMKALMKKAIDDMVKDDIDLSVLGGRRHRYGYFGFEKCDGMLYFSLTPKTVSYVHPAPAETELREVKKEDDALLDELYTAMHARPYHALRPREELFDILVSWHSRPYAFFHKGRLVGWAVHYTGKGQLSEFGVLDPALTGEMLTAAVRTLGSLSIAIPTWDSTLAGEVDRFAETVNSVSNECFLILNWQKVLATLFAFKAARTPLLAGELVVKIEGVKEAITLKLTVKDGRAAVAPCEEAPALTLSSQEAEAFFFRNFSARRSSLPAAPASWLPLPLFIFEPDNV